MNNLKYKLIMRKINQSLGYVSKISYIKRTLSIEEKNRQNICQV